MEVPQFSTAVDLQFLSSCKGYTNMEQQDIAGEEQISQARRLDWENSTKKKKKKKQQQKGQNSEEYKDTEEVKKNISLLRQ